MNNINDTLNACELDNYLDLFVELKIDSLKLLSLVSKDNYFYDGVVSDEKIIWISSTFDLLLRDIELINQWLFIENTEKVLIDTDNLDYFDLKTILANKTANIVNLIQWIIDIIENSDYFSSDSNKYLSFLKKRKNKQILLDIQETMELLIENFAIFSYETNNEDINKHVEFISGAVNEVLLDWKAIWIWHMEDWNILILNEPDKKNLN